MSYMISYYHFFLMSHMKSYQYISEILSIYLAIYIITFYPNISQTEFPHLKGLSFIFMIDYVTFRAPD